MTAKQYVVVQQTVKHLLAVEGKPINIEEIQTISNAQLGKTQQLTRNQIVHILANLVSSVRSRNNKNGDQ
jgi:hypothetical protein